MSDIENEQKAREDVTHDLMFIAEKVRAHPENLEKSQVPAMKKKKTTVLTKIVQQYVTLFGHKDFCSSEWYRNKGLTKESGPEDIRTDVGGTKIELVKEIKYLGILLDTKLNFQNHVNQACNRAKKILIALRKKLFKTWNPPVAESLHTIYRCAVVPILAYASEIWSPRLHLSKIKRKIYSVYGLASKIIIGGYSSCSHEAAGVVAGLPPLDLALWQVTCKKKLKKEPAANYLDQQIIRSDFENFRQINEYLNLVTLDVWQLRWETSSKGRVTYKFFPTIPSLPRTSLSRLSTQTLTGHGPFQIHLHRIEKVKVMLASAATSATILCTGYSTAPYLTRTAPDCSNMRAAK
ncbi:hypothetical protein GEV33_009743 [Tenebrio molitor]|uniref:Uncharacterized protein n=1 Tax=Tenebrio molitor TaxID=7067 RepID=A0A8J6HE81_TENMO|nr:hypothetical protein GEV33_009743 [Tenebrio molitor]